MRKAYANAVCACSLSQMTVLVSPCDSRIFSDHIDTAYECDSFFGSAGLSTLTYGTVAKGRYFGAYIRKASATHFTLLPFVYLGPLRSFALRALCSGGLLRLVLGRMSRRMFRLPSTSNPASSLRLIESSHISTPFDFKSS